ncbi:MAG: alpha/beta hydrolase [Oscillospiraceae bacterium]|jgi:pimeloyl-ACP methyl ester carboxylesterase|nr:alpha/beta hydrolase [Oscillospiraceae bacterium]
MSVDTVEAGGFSVRYLALGEGPCLLFLHGWGVGADSYTPLLTHLAARFRVVAPDLPGMGGTLEPTEPWGVGDYAAFVRAFAAALGLAPRVLMGHSNGGRVLLKLQSDPAIAFPADKMVLIDSAGIRPRHPPLYYVKVYAYKTGKVLLTPFPGLKRRLQTNAGSADYRAASPVMRGTLSRLVGADLTPLLPAVRPGALLLWGDRDTATPLRDGRLMAAGIPGAGLALLPGGGHWAVLEQLPLALRILDSYLQPEPI